MCARHNRLLNFTARSFLPSFDALAAKQSNEPNGVQEHHRIGTVFATEHVEVPRPPLHPYAAALLLVLLWQLRFFQLVVIVLSNRVFVLERLLLVLLVISLSFSCSCFCGDQWTSLWVSPRDHPLSVPFEVTQGVLRNVRHHLLPPLCPLFFASLSSFFFGS